VWKNEQSPTGRKDGGIMDPKEQKLIDVCVEADREWTEANRKRAEASREQDEAHYKWGEADRKLRKYRENKKAQQNEKVA